MAEPLIDRATFDALKETVGAEFLVELVDTFLAEAPAMIADMRHALAAGYADPFRRAAHSLKSNSHTFGATQLGEMARALEHGGLDSVRANAAPIDALADEYDRVAAALSELRDG
jgi:HPt (histidine-containing phosphotransfer) domain-containing protein